MDRRGLIFTGLLAGTALAAAAAPAAAPAAADIPARFAATLSAGDMKAFADLFAEDYVNHQNSAAAPAPFGKSPKQVSVAFFANRVDSLEGLTVKIEASLSQGDLCAASFLYEGMHQKVYYGFAPTGRKIRFTSCDIFRIADGKIAEHWGMGDIAGVLAQLKS